jgi:ribonuclease HI
LGAVKIETILGPYDSNAVTDEINKQWEFNMSYNGWKNRQTWLVNVHFGDYLQELVEDGYRVDADFIKQVVDDHFQEQVKDLSMFVQDMIDDAGIDWDELAAHYPQDEEEAA